MVPPKWQKVSMSSVKKKIYARVLAFSWVIVLASVKPKTLLLQSG